MGYASTTLAQACQRDGALLMGVVNVTPDSFFDGGRHLSTSDAVNHVDALLAQGAGLLDIGGESTRPGAPPVPAPIQLERIIPIVEHALARNACVSVDTTDPQVADRVLRLGAHIINDVSCLADPLLAEVVARHRATLILMHSREPMSQMAGFSSYPEDGYGDVVQDVRQEWGRARDLAVARGVPRAEIWFDPGLGFNKSARHSLTLLARLDEFSREGVPMVVGASRKSFIASDDNSPPESRLGGSIAACLAAVTQGASVLRVHDVQETLQALRLTRSLDRNRQPAARERVRG